MSRVDSPDVGSDLGLGRVCDETPYDNGDGWVSLGPGERVLLIEHRDGVPWYRVPVPPRRHRCAPQTRALFDDIERCACGAFRFRHGLGSGVWDERNSRADSPRRRRDAILARLRCSRG